MNKDHIPTPNNTVTRSLPDLWAETGNIYKSVRIIAKRANQISANMKSEIDTKLREFAAYQETLDTPLENEEQIEISKHYEQMPKPTLVATTEFLNGELHFESGSKMKHRN